MRVLSTIVMLGISLLVAGTVLAADQEKEKPQPGERPRGQMMGPFELLKGLDLSDDQKSKIEDLKKEYQPKLRESYEKMQSILTDEQKKIREESMKSAREAGKDMAGAWKTAQEAMKLTDEQKAKMAEAGKALGDLGKEIRDKVGPILTPEQQEQVKKKMESMRGRFQGQRKQKEGKPADDK